MTDVEQKALAMVNAIQDERGKGFRYLSLGRLGDSTAEALCRAIEQHEATKQELNDFRQEVSDALVWYFGSKEGCVSDALRDFIIPTPKPDPLVEVMKEAGWADAVIASCAPSLSAALNTRGLEIREKNDDR